MMMIDIKNKEKYKMMNKRKMCKVINRVGKNVMKKIKNGRVIKVNKI
jgi:hypothetical protein